LDPDPTTGDDGATRAFTTEMTAVPVEEFEGASGGATRSPDGFPGGTGRVDAMGPPAKIPPPPSVIRKMIEDTTNRKVRTAATRSSTPPRRL
jgi:hypothetical protein